MSLVTYQVNGDPMEPALHPLTFSFERILSELVGVLSRFIIRRQFDGRIGGDGDMMDKDGFLKIIDEIVEEALILVGEERAKDLREEYIELTELFFKEDEMHDQ